MYAATLVAGLLSLAAPDQPIGDPFFSALEMLIVVMMPPMVALMVVVQDVFFALSALFAAPAFNGSGIAKWIRALLVVSGTLALAGLSGVVAGDMRLRNIGILGYAGVFPVAAGLMAILFYRARLRETTAARRRTGS